MTGQTKKAAPKRQINDNLIEQLRGITSSVGKSVTSDLISPLATDALSSLLGIAPKQGEMKPNQPINLPQPDNQPKPEMNFEKPVERNQDHKQTNFSQDILSQFRQSENQVAQKIEEIRIEIKALIKSINTINKEIENTVAADFVDPGQYHLSFLDRLRTVLKLMRKNLNDSATWLQVMRSRRKEKRYWNMYKKKGTTFGLSNERTVSTQVG